MDVIYLGQAGLLFKSKDICIIIDPYLSNSVEKVDSNAVRRIPVNEEFLNLVPDVIVITHDHLDHYDFETLIRYVHNAEKSNRKIVFLCPDKVYDKALCDFSAHNIILFDRHTEWSESGVIFKAVKAAHSERGAIGVIIEDTFENKVYYVTGDTLYNSDIFEDIPDNIHALFLPINGVGNNMNMKDASRFSKRVDAKYTVPYHFGMFDELSGHMFECENKVVPEPYKSIILK